MIKNNKYEVLTSNGFKDFKGIKKANHKTSTKFIFTDNTSIHVSKKHKFFEDAEFICANNLKIDDTISNKNIRSIKEINKSDNFYDLVEVEGGHHYTTSGIESSNCAFIKSSLWEEFSNSIFPAQSGLAWKKNILISTANGLNHFHDIVKGARNDTNGYIPFEVSWKDVPRYKPDGTIMSNDEFQTKIVNSKGAIHFNQNYGNTFLGSSHTLISASKISSMKAKEIEFIRDNKLNIYEVAKPKHKYIMAVDSCKDGIDAFSVQIIDITEFNFKQVASAQLQIDYLLMPEFLDEWGKEYNNAYLIIENNEGSGQSIADQMYLTYEYENLHFDKDVDRNKKKKYPGFRTTKKSRKQIIQTLKLFIENDKLSIIDKGTINEFHQFILIKNKFQADDGAHDDMIMSLALVFVPFCNMKNFEDMKKLVQNLYDDDIPEIDKADFGELLVLGSFDSMDDSNYEEQTGAFDNIEYENIEDAILAAQGFI